MEWNRIFLFVKIMFSVIMLSIFMASLIVYVVTDLGNDALELPFPMS